MRQSIWMILDSLKARFQRAFNAPSPIQIDSHTFELPLQMCTNPLMYAIAQ